MLSLKTIRGITLAVGLTFTAGRRFPMRRLRSASALASLFPLHLRHFPSTSNRLSPHPASSGHRAIGRGATPALLFGSRACGCGLPVSACFGLLVTGGSQAASMAGTPATGDRTWAFTAV